MTHLHLRTAAIAASLALAVPALAADWFVTDESGHLTGRYDRAPDGGMERYDSSGRYAGRIVSDDGDGWLVYGADGRLEGRIERR